MFITLAFSLHNTYFNTVIKLHIYKPAGGFGKLSLSLLRQLKKILVSYADPSHPTHVNVNFMSKSHGHMQFVVVIHFLPLYGCYSLMSRKPKESTQDDLLMKQKLNCQFLVVNLESTRGFPKSTRRIKTRIHQKKI